MFGDDRASRSFMPDMVAMFSNSGFQLLARLSNIRSVIIIAQNFINNIAFRCTGTSVLLDSYIFDHFVRAVEGHHTSLLFNFIVLLLK